MKAYTVSGCIVTYNNKDKIAKTIESVLKQTQGVPFTLYVVDNASTDRTRELIEQQCSSNKKFKAIFNVTNFGQFNSPFHGICSLYGDCVIPICADFQDPVEMIPLFIREWEKGYKIVIGKKTSR